ARRFRYIARQDAIALTHPDATTEYKREVTRRFMQIGSAYKIANRLDLALEVAREGVQLGSKLEPNYPLPLNFLSGLELTKGNLKEALQYALQAVSLTESAPGPVGDGLGYQAAGKV